MTQTERTRRSYDTVADRYTAEIGDELRRKPMDRALLDVIAELAAGGTVGDIGCGPAQAAAYLATCGVPTVATDLSPAMCAAARRVSRLPACAADMTALPLTSRALAGSVCMYAVIHLGAGTGRRVHRVRTRTPATRSRSDRISHQ